MKLLNKVIDNTLSAATKTVKNAADKAKTMTIRDSANAKTSNAIERAHEVRTKTGVLKLYNVAISNGDAEKAEEIWNDYRYRIPDVDDGREYCDERACTDENTYYLRDTEEDIAARKWHSENEKLYYEMLKSISSTLDKESDKNTRSYRALKELESKRDLLLKECGGKIEYYGSARKANTKYGKNMSYLSFTRELDDAVCEIPLINDRPEYDIDYRNANMSREEMIDFIRAAHVTFSVILFRHTYIPHTTYIQSACVDNGHQLRYGACPIESDEHLHTNDTFGARNSCLAPHNISALLFLQGRINEEKDARRLYFIMQEVYLLNATKYFNSLSDEKVLNLKNALSEIVGNTDELIQLRKVFNELYLAHFYEQTVEDKYFNLYEYTMHEHPEYCDLLTKIKSWYDDVCPAEFCKENGADTKEAFELIGIPYIYITNFNNFLLREPGSKEKLVRYINAAYKDHYYDYKYNSSIIKDAAKDKIALKPIEEYTDSELASVLEDRIYGNFLTNKYGYNQCNDIYRVLGYQKISTDAYTKHLKSFSQMFNDTFKTFEEFALVKLIVPTRLPNVTPAEYKKLQKYIVENIPQL